MRNTAYHSPYDLVDNKVNAIYIVYKIRNYDGTGIEHNYLFSFGMSDNHRGICFRDEKTMRVYGVADKPHYMDISNFPTSYYNPCRKDMWNVVCVVYDTTSGKSSLWVNHGKIRDLACRLPLRASTLNLFNRVVYFDESSGFNGYIESVEMYNYFNSIPTGLISSRMTYLCETFKIPKRADGTTALSELNHIIDATFSNIEQFVRFDRYTTFQSLCTALDHQVEDELMRQQECDCSVVGKSWDLKLQIHLLEKRCTQLAGVIAHISLKNPVKKCTIVTTR